MENKKGKTKTKSKNKRLIILFLIIILGLIFLAGLVTSTGIKSYLNESLEVANISYLDLEKISAKMSYKDIVEELGKTKDVGTNKHIALYKIDDRDYLYLEFTDFNATANLDRDKLQAKIVKVSMEDLGRLYLEIKVHEDSKKIKIIDDYETLKTVLNIFEADENKKDSTSLKTSPNYYVKAAFNVTGVGLVYLDNYQIWFGDKVAVKKAKEKTYYLSEEDSKILKEIFLGA